jgi:NAD(P)-dependent dehydrogenase (short-subunit alcohol dehydrogenase family)
VFNTAASTGIGYALAQRLDARGWQVFAGVRNHADARRLRAVFVGSQ